jgi:hypothetical protein
MRIMCYFWSHIYVGLADLDKISSRVTINIQGV